MSDIPLNDIQILEPDAIIDLYKVDATAQGAGILYFHAGTNQLSQNIVWQGTTYVRYPVEATGFQFTSNGPAPRPKFAVSNILSSITALLMTADDLVGAKVTRKRTLKKYLDAVNFTGGVNASADPTVYFPDDIFYVDRKVNESRVVVEFELVSAIDLSNVMLPKRQVIQNLCPWSYRGTECGYAGTNYYDANDNPIFDSTLDVCSKRLTGCQMRFGAGAELPFGSFPGADLYKGG